ncbi:putative aminoacrylate hydrolase RutD [Carnimonas sp. R-84981]|uniref:alpha/beta fold hydrolase n=1 Tax=Carnimonas bestiolae TaxID=3402172 RepID=UPI003EDC6F4F
MRTTTRQLCYAVATTFTLLPLAAFSATSANADTAKQGASESLPHYGAELKGFDYGWPVSHFSFNSQRQSLQMAYIDAKPEHPNGKVAVLLHGKNFCAGTWDTTIKTLTEHGYRVIAPDQIGFCKSSQPQGYQFSFEQLAHNTHALLAHLGIDHYTLIGHSTGGMLGARYSLMFPDNVEQLVMVNPIGLEDWRAKGVPSQSVDELYQSEHGKTAADIRHYEQTFYYANHWQPEYDKWVNMLAGMYRGEGSDQVAWNSALLSDMIYTQPVIHEFPNIRVPTVLMIGEKDTTAPGKAKATPEVQRQLGHYPELGRAAAKAIPNAELVTFPEDGHAPQIQSPKQFHQQLLDHLNAAADK